jgi:hypothetical protein
MRLPGANLFASLIGKARARERVARTIFHVVIAGLDPAIHAGRVGLLRLTASHNSWHVTMDHRVKPGGDDKKLGGSVDARFSEQSGGLAPRAQRPSSY